MRMIQKLQARWGLESGGQVVIVMLVFAITGMSILPTRKWVFHLLHFDTHTPFALKFLVWLAVVFPTYHLLLLVYGALFGQFRFFWAKEKKMGRFLLRCFGLRGEPEVPLAGSE